MGWAMTVQKNIDQAGGMAVIIILILLAIAVIGEMEAPTEDVLNPVWTATTTAVMDKTFTGIIIVTAISNTQKWKYAEPHKV